MADHGDRAHAEYAPSAAYRWMRCHGSIAASRGVPQGPSSVYAEEGTQCHEAASEILDGMAFDKATAGLSTEQKNIVEEYTEFCFDIGEALEEYGTPQIMVEKRMHAPGISRKFFGTGDWLGLSGDVLRVIDLKAGAIPVYVRDKAGRVNPQLASYVLLALAELGAPVSPWHFDPGAIGVRKIKLTIVQPRVYDAPQTTVVDVDELEEFLGDLSRAIDAIEAGDDTRHAGEWCKFCPAKGACPELRAQAVKKAAMDFEPVSNIPFAEWAAILAEAEMIGAHINGIREKIRRAIEAGRTVPGFKLVEKRKLKAWKDWEYTERHLLAAGFTDRQIYRRSPMSPAAIAKLSKLNKLPFDMTGHFDVTSSGLTIVSDTDPRPEVKPDPGADFAED